METGEDMHVAHDELWRAVSSALSGVIPDPAPAAPSGSQALVTLLAWVKWGALVCCAGAGVTAGGMIAVGNTSRRAEMAERGKVTLICAVLGSVIVAIAGTLISSSYGLG